MKTIASPLFSPWSSVEMIELVKLFLFWSSILAISAPIALAAAGIFIALGLVVTTPLAAVFPTWQRINFALHRTVNFIVHNVFMPLLKAYATAAMYLLTPILNLIRPVVRPFFHYVILPIFKNLVQPVYHFCIYHKLKLNEFLSRKTSLPHYFFRSDNDHLPILKYAAQRGYLNRIQWLQSKGLDVHTNVRGGYPLFFAVENKHFDVVKFLLASDPYIKTRPEWDLTILLEVAVKKDHQAILKAVLTVLTEDQISFAAQNSDMVYMSPIILNHRLGKLAETMLPNMITLLKLMYQVKGKAFIESELILHNIAPLIETKPEWCHEKAYKNFCAKLLKMAKEKVTKQQQDKTANARLTHDNSDKLPKAPEPVILSPSRSARKEEEAVSDVPEVAVQVLPDEQRLLSP